MPENYFWLNTLSVMLGTFVVWFFITIWKWAIKWDKEHGEKIIDIKTAPSVDGIVRKSAMPQPSHIPPAPLPIIPSRVHYPNTVSYTSYLSKEEREINARKLYKRIYFTYQDQACEKLRELRDLIFTYGEVTVSDYYILSGRSWEQLDNKIGWKNLSKVAIVQTSCGYTIDLPRPITLGEER